MAQGQVAHYPWAWSWVFFGILNCFLATNGVFEPRTVSFFEKNGQKGQKITPEVADGHHGGLGRGKKGKNSLEVGHSFKKNWSILGYLWGFFISILSTNNEQDFFSKKKAWQNASFDPTES